MPYNSNIQKLYVDTESTPNKGITLGEIALCIRDYRLNKNGRRDLGMLCTSPNINKWAKYKPFLVSDSNDHPHEVQTEADRQAAGYGFYWQDFIGEEICPIQKAATYAFENGVYYNCDWQYNTAERIFRIQDFDGYKHNAEIPYTTEAVASGDYDLTKTGIIKTDLYNGNIECRLSAMPALTGSYDDVMDDLEIVALVREINSYDLDIIHTGMKVYQLDKEYGLTEASFKCTPTIEGDEKVYELVWAAYNGKSVENKPVWIYLPNGYQIFRFKGYFSVKYNEYELKFQASDVNGRVVTSATQYPKTSNFWFENFFNINNYRAGGEVIFNVWNATSGSRQEFRYDLINDGQMDILEMDVQSALGGANAENSMITMDVYVRDLNIPVITSPEYTAYHFNFLENKLELGVADASDGVSLWDIIEYVNS